MRCFALFFAVLTVLAPASLAFAQDEPSIEARRQQLMLIVRGTEGEPRHEEALLPLGSLKAKVAGDKEIEVNFAACRFIGNLIVQFVFNSPRSIMYLKTDDLEKLGLDANQALELAIANVRRVLGPPQVQTSWLKPSFVRGRALDYNPSYMLDRAFWKELTKQHPDGIVVAVPTRTILYFATAKDTKALETLRKETEQAYGLAGRIGVSPSLFLFKDDRWTVFQTP